MAALLWYGAGWGEASVTPAGAWEYGPSNHGLAPMARFWSPLSGFGNCGFGRC